MLVKTCCVLVRATTSTYIYGIPLQWHDSRHYCILYSKLSGNTSILIPPHPTHYAQPATPIDSLSLFPSTPIHNTDLVCSSFSSFPYTHRHNAHCSPLPPSQLSYARSSPAHTTSRFELCPLPAPFFDLLLQHRHIT